VAAACTGRGRAVALPDGSTVKPGGISPLFSFGGEKTRRRKNDCLWAKSVGQGCQIVLGATYQNGKNMPKMTTKNAKRPQNLSYGSKIDKMSLKFTNIFHCKTLRNLPKLAFLV
jgi:hypothetical protein